MSSEKSKEIIDKVTFCSPEHVQNMFQMMGKCCTGKGMFDCSFMMEALKGQSCWGPEPEKATGSSEEEKKSCCCC